MVMRVIRSMTFSFDAAGGTRCTNLAQLVIDCSASACNQTGNLIYIAKGEIFLRDLPRHSPRRNARGKATGARMERTNVGIRSGYMRWLPANDFHRGVPPL
jgi:hypothetical protein